MRELLNITMLNKNLKVASRVWIFQCNPDKYRIIEALNDDQVSKCFHWQVKQHKKEITPGDLALIWCSGSSAGIYAVAEIISNPVEETEIAQEKMYWIGDTGERGSQCRVKMRLVIKMMDTPILKKTIVKTKGLQNLSVVRMPRGTNFTVGVEEWKILNGLIP